MTGINGTVYQRITSAIDVRRLGPIENGKTRCPLHSSKIHKKNASLTIREFNGKVVLHCDEGCKREDVVQALDMWEVRDQIIDPPQDCSVREGTIADRLVDLTDNAELFHTPDGVPYAAVPVGKHVETHPIRGRGFRLWLTRQMWEREQRAVSADVLRQAIGVLEGQALFDGDEAQVHARVAGIDDGTAVYLDLADADWRVVEVTATGWRIMDQAPVRFRRAPGMLSLPAPVNDGNLAELAQFVNVEGGADGEDFALLVGELVAALRPRGPYPVQVLQGEQGSAKSTTARVQRRLVDPNQAELRAQPREPRDVAIAANNAWMIALDNLSGVADWLSDALCRLATGGGFATRSLYTDDEETIFDAQRPIILNGIDSVGTRGDLLDRSIILNLPRIEKYRPEAELWADFEAARPRLLGALLGAISTAIGREKQVTLEQSVRMADAARWVVAAEPSLPWKEGTFLKAYATNRTDANVIALEASLIVEPMQEMMKAIREWSGTASDLLRQLEQHVSEKVLESKGWPKKPNVLSTALRRIAPNLPAIGFKVEFGLNSDRKRTRKITLTRIPQEAEKDRPGSSDRPPDAEASEHAGDSQGRSTDDHADDRLDRPPEGRPHASHGNHGASDDADGADDRLPPPAEEFFL